MPEQTKDKHCKKIDKHCKTCASKIIHYFKFTWIKMHTDSSNNNQTETIICNGEESYSSPLQSCWNIVPTLHFKRFKHFSYSKY